jgi:hypothetical protein
MHYRGERWFPLVLQNVHRYFAYVAVIFLILLAYDVWLALWFPDPQTGRREVRHWRRHDRAGGERRPSELLHLRLPLAAARARRARRRSVDQRRA